MKKNTKVLASTLLILTIIGAMIAWNYRFNFWGGLALAMCQAGLAGALADWFAVVALFRHPLGLKFIPHTAIIPNNRGRIIESIIHMVQNEWLKREIIIEKIQKYNFTEKVFEIIKTQEGKCRLNEVITSLLSNTVKDLEPEKVAVFIQGFLKENTNIIKISPEIVENLEMTFKKIYGDKVLDFFIEGSNQLIESKDFQIITQNTLRKAADEYSKGGFLRRVGKGLGERLDLINYGEAAKSVSHKLKEVLNGMKSPSNSYRAKVKQNLMNMRIIQGEAVPGIFDTWFKNTVENEDGYKFLVELVRSLKNQLISGDIKKSILVYYLCDMILEQVNKLSLDISKKEQVEAWIKGEILKLIERYHDVIGKLVRENLERLDDAAFSSSLEERVGEDLQWIRVNGTIIGGLVGALQYVIMHFI